MSILLTVMMSLAGCSNPPCLDEGCKIQFKMPFYHDGNIEYNEKAVLYNYCRCQSMKEKQYRDEDYKTRCKGVL